MKRAAICAATLLASATASQKLRQDDEASTAPEYTYLEDYNPLSPGPEWFHWVNFAFGIVGGFYGPLAERAQSYGCFGQTVSLGWAMYSYHHYFNDMQLSFDPENVDILELVTLSVRAIGTGYGGYRWWIVCQDEAKYFLSSAVGAKFIAGTATTDVDGDAGYQPLFDTFYLVALLGNGWDAYMSFTHHGWDTFDFTIEAGQGLSRLLMFLDKVAKIGIVKPQKPWTRYLSVA